MRLISKLCLLLILSCSFAPYAGAQEAANLKPLEILRVTPSTDDVQPPKQIVFLFNQPVVPLGRMERNASEVPVEITPALPCEWRWLNTTSLSCNLPDGATKRATTYDIIVKANLAAQNGARLEQAQSYKFITARPRVSYTDFEDWQGPSRPVIRVTINQPVTKASLEKALAVKTENGQTYPVRIKPFTKERTQPELVKLPHENGWFAWFKKKPDAPAQKPDNQSGDEAMKNRKKTAVAGW